MRKPSQMEVFDALYALAARNGRGEALFGSTIAVARHAYEKTLIGNSYPHVYLEFPLLGAPCFDFLTVYEEVTPGARFNSGAGFGRQALFDWFTSVQDGKHIGCGLELDTSTGETEVAGVYFQQRQKTELVGPFLDSVGEGHRLHSYLNVLERLPQGWDPAYVGLFPGRNHTPLRIGGYLSTSAREQCIKHPSYLREVFDSVGFTAYNNEMLMRCHELLKVAHAFDYQFDIMPDGSLGPVFGLSVSFNETTPRLARACMTDGYGARTMELFESWSLADERWQLIADTAFARHIPFERDDGTEGHLALCVVFNYAKVKFKDGVAQPAKFYLHLHGMELEDVKDE